MEHLPNFGSYFNPFSARHKALNHFAELKKGKILIVIATLAATILTLPLLGLVGIAVFRKLTEREWSRQPPNKISDFVQNQLQIDPPLKNSSGAGEDTQHNMSDPDTLVKFILEKIKSNFKKEDVFEKGKIRFNEEKIGDIVNNFTQNPPKESLKQFSEQEMLDFKNTLRKNHTELEITLLISVCKTLLNHSFVTSRQKNDPLTKSLQTITSCDRAPATDNIKMIKKLLFDEKSLQTNEDVKKPITVKKVNEKLLFDRGSLVTMEDAKALIASLINSDGTVNKTDKGVFSAIAHWINRYHVSFTDIGCHTAEQAKNYCLAMGEKIRFLDLDGIELTKDDLEKIQAHCPNIETLTIRDCGNQAIEYVLENPSNFPALKKLAFNESLTIRLCEMKNLKNLVSLDLSGDHSILNDDLEGLKRSAKSDRIRFIGL